MKLQLSPETIFFPHFLTKIKDKRFRSKTKTFGKDLETESKLRLP